MEIEAFQDIKQRVEELEANSGSGFAESSEGSKLEMINLAKRVRDPEEEEEVKEKRAKKSGDGDGSKSASMSVVESKIIVGLAPLPAMGWQSQ